MGQHLKRHQLIFVSPTKISNKIVPFLPLIFGLPKEIKGCFHNFHNLEFVKTIHFILMTEASSLYVYIIV